MTEDLNDLVQFTFSPDQWTGSVGIRRLANVRERPRYFYSSSRTWETLRAPGLGKKAIIDGLTQVIADGTLASAHQQRTWQA